MTTVPRQTGRAVEPAAATSALRIPGRWDHFPGRVKKWVRQLFDANPLRQRRAEWLRICGGAPGFEFVAYVLEHGLIVAPPDQRPAPFDLPNHPSMRDAERAPLAAAVLQEEVDQGLIVCVDGCRWMLSNQCLWWHPLGALPKAPMKVRVIHDHSAPSGAALNDGVDYVRTSYAGVDRAFVAVRPGCYMAKLDLKAFFRHLGIDPADWGLMAFRWEQRRFVDTRVNFGGRNSPEVAHSFAMAVLWAVEREMSSLDLGYVVVLVVCDDWLVVAELERECQQVWEMLMRILHSLGFAFAPHKCVGPCRLILWLGLLLDSVRMTVSLPAVMVRTTPVR